MNSTDQRLFLHQHVYSNYMDKLLYMILEDMKCFYTDFDEHQNIISIKIKKTDFKKIYRKITEDILYDMLDDIFREFFKSILTSLPEDVQPELCDIIELPDLRLLYSIVILSGGDVSIKI